MTPENESKVEGIDAPPSAPVESEASLALGYDARELRPVLVCQGCTERNGGKITPTRHEYMMAAITVDRPVSFRPPMYRCTAAGCGRERVWG